MTPAQRTLLKLIDARLAILRKQKQTLEKLRRLVRDTDPSKMYPVFDALRDVRREGLI